MKHFVLGALILLLTLPPIATAQTIEAKLATLMKRRKFKEDEELTSDRIASNPGDDFAMWFLANIVAGDASKRDAVIAKSSDCVAALPKSAKCRGACAT